MKRIPRPHFFFKLYHLIKKEGDSLALEMSSFSLVLTIFFLVLKLNMIQS